MSPWRRVLDLLLLGSLLLAASPACVCGADPAAAEDPLLAGFRDPPKGARPSTYWLWLNGYVNRDHVERELKALHDAGIRGVLIFDMGARGSKEAAPPAGPTFMSEQSVADVAHAVRIAGELGMDVQLSVASSWDMGGTWVEPLYASMGLFTSQVTVEGPKQYDEVLPFPRLPAKAPRRADGQPAYYKDIAVLGVPAHRRLPGHDFIFRLDPPGVHTLDHAVLYNTQSDQPAKHGERQLFAKDFSIAVSTTKPAQGAFREVLKSSLKPALGPQRFDLPPTEARYVRLRLLSGHNPRFDRIQLGEFELFDSDGTNVVASHGVDRSRDGADLIGSRSTLGSSRDWTAENIHDGAKSGPHGSWSSAGLPPLLIDDPGEIVDLTDRLDERGRLNWEVPPGRWAIMRFVCSNTGERLKVPSPNSDGLATDHLSHEATRVFLDYLIGRLQSKLGDLGQTALKQLYLASYEVRGTIWTPELTERFRHYRGYEMTPYLPTLLGNVVTSDEVTQRFVYDYRKTLGDLLVDAYYRAAVEAAHAAGLGVESEAGGPGPPIHQVPVDALKAQGALDEIRGEFWPKRPSADRLWVVKETACAAHVYGKRRVHMEAFTSMHHWQDGPWDLKPSADRALCEGTNHFVWHTASHLPPEAGKPGWVYGAGTHLNTNLVWWPKARPFLDYLARCSFLLQQGHFVGDVCYYYGDQGYNFVPPKHVDPSLGFGFDYDVTNREVILTRMSVCDGRITLPDGMSYALLVLPEREDIDLEVLEKIDRLVRDGATVVGPKPTRCNGLTDYPRRDQQVRQLADRLWGPCDGKNVLEHRYGQGRVVWGRSLREVLAERGTGPDFSFTSDHGDTELDFIHRRTKDADIYFLRNQRPRWERFEGTFRVCGRSAELWEPHTGRAVPQYVLKTTATTTALPLQLPPYGSVFVVFRQTENRLPTMGLDQPDDSVGVAAARVESWDGRDARLAVFRPGRYRIVTDRGRAAELAVKALPEPLDLHGPWEVRFPGGDGAPPVAHFDRLISWTEHEDDGIHYFSGIAEYRRQFRLPADWLDEDRRVLLDLGNLWCVGEVFLNGRPLGVLWKPPFVMDVTSAAVAGNNTLEVEIANTWSNRLVGDARVPPQQRRTRTNVLRTGGRAWKDAPLLESGLFGPVRLVPGRVLVAEPK